MGRARTRGGTSIISVHEYTARFVGDLGFEFLVFLGAFRGDGVTGLSNVIALRRGVFEWGEYAFAKTKDGWHV